MNIEAWTEALPDEALREVESREWHNEESEAYCKLLDEHHYLSRRQSEPTARILQ